MQYKRIVLNEPHASIEGLYDNQLSFWNIDECFINDIVLKCTDWHTDYLFHGYRVNLFEDYGYKVGINEPYSNSETPDCSFPYQSMMLEVNKRAYMEDGSLHLTYNTKYKCNVRAVFKTLLSELNIE